MSDWMPETGTPPVSTPGGRDTSQDGPPTGGPASESAAPAPLGVARTPTGHAPVDAELERLGGADHLATEGHIAVYEDVHRGLRSALTSLDARPAAVPGPGPTPSHRTHDDNRS
ncbi:hypothetical protein [Streptomyces pratensis]|uniref:hypothetical protein n=1 Tax=Streptomyces pratensis TaxID=1169025 RepID=UPI00301A5201